MDIQCVPASILGIITIIAVLCLIFRWFGLKKVRSFYVWVGVLAVLGGAWAFLFPLAINADFSQNGDGAALRQMLIYTTGGILGVITLGENHRKNSLEKAKNDQDHTRQVRAERRNRYTTAIEQLSDDKASIRLGGIYSLVGLVDEWLADEKTTPSLEERRKEGQVIINNLCAYIRSPFLPAEHAEQLDKPYAKNLQNDFDGDKEKFNADKQAFKQQKATLEEERQIRLNIVQEIRGRLRNVNESGPWSDFDYNFSNAHFFYYTDFSDSIFGAFTDFSGAKFTKTSFLRAKFTKADFSGAKFTKADFSRAEFTKTSFFRAKFTGYADFSRAKFTGASFFRAEFTKTSFFRAKFTEDADFSRAKFTEDADFSRAEFTKTSFFRAKFTGYADFSRAKFTEDADFSGAEFTKTSFFRAKFTGYADFSGAKFTGASFFRAEFTKTSFFRAKFTRYADFSMAKFTRYADFSMAKFTQNADFSKAKFSHMVNPRNYNFDVSSNSHKIETEEQEHNSVNFTIPKGATLFDPDDPSGLEDDDGS